MPNEQDTAFYATWARAGFDAAEGAYESLGWWLTGGVALLIWTGLALLLTNA